MGTKKNLMLVVLGLFFLISFVPQASAFEWCEWIPFWQCEDDGTNNILTADSQWTFLYEDGVQEEYFDWTIEDMKNNPTKDKKKICLWPKEDMYLNNSIVQETVAYLYTNGVQTGLVEPNDMEVEIEPENDFLVKMCVDVDAGDEDYIKFGQNSTAFAYENETLRVTDENGTVLQDTILEYNTEQCILNCKAGGRVVIYNDSVLFEDFDFVSSSNQTVDLGGANIYLLEDGYDYTVSEEILYDNCTTAQWNEQNATNSTMYGCSLNAPSGNFTNVTYQEDDYYTEYNFQVLPAGSYDWEIRGSKDDLNSIDWAVAFQGFSTDTIRQYWAWWNSSWMYHKEISNLTGEYPTFNLTKPANANDNWGDTRFLDPNPSDYYLWEGEGVAYGDLSAGLTTDLIGYWKLDEGTGTSTSDEVGSVDGTASVSGLLSSSGKLGGSADRTVAGGNIALGSRVGDATGAMSVSLWAKYTANGWVIFNRGASTDDWTLSPYPNGLRFDIFTGTSGTATRDFTINSLGSLDDNEWHHFAITKPSGADPTIRMYIDGVGYDVTSVVGGVGGGSGYVFGSRGDGGAGLTGSFDEIGIWDAELTDAQIYEIYNEQKNLYTQEQELNYTFRQFDGGQGLAYASLPTDLTTDLASYWALDDSSGDAIDSHGSNDGTLNGGVTQSATGKLSTAYSFDGVDDYVDLKYDISLGTTDDMTWNLWIKTTDNVGQSDIMMTDDGDYIGFVTRGTYLDRIRWDSRVNGEAKYVQSEIITADDEWHMVTGVWKGGDQIELYVDGILQGTETISAQTVNIDNVWLGGGNWLQPPETLTRPIDADIDEVGIWESALTVDQIRELYQSQYAYVTVDTNFLSLEGQGTDYASLSTGIKTDLVNHYELDGDLLDSHGSDDGTNNGGQTGFLGKLGESYRYEGQADYSTLATGFSKTDVVSYALWFKAENQANGGLLATRFTTGGDNDRGVVLQDGYIQVSRYDLASGGDNTFLYYTDYSDGKWHHIAVVETSTGADLYYDGRLVATKTQVNSYAVLSGRTIPIGAKDNDGVIQDYFNGQIDEVMFWDAEIDADDVAELYNRESKDTIAWYYGNEDASTTSADDFFQDPTAYYGLDGNTGDLTLNGNSGTATGVTETTGYISSAYDFGSTKNIVVPKTVEGQTAFTTSVWVNADTLTSTMDIFSQDSVFQGASYIHGTGWRGFVDAPTSATRVYVYGTTTPVTDEWVHISLTYDGQFIKFYINGELEDAEADSGTVDTEVAWDQKIGQWSSGNEFDGQIDEVGVWQKALTNQEIYELSSLSDQTDYFILSAEFTDNFVPTVTLVTPANDTLVNTNTYNGNFSFIPIDEDSPIDNCTLHLWNVTSGLEEYSQTDLTITNGTLNSIIQIVDATNYTWNVNCLDNESASGWATENFTLFVIPIPDNAPNIEDNSTSVANGTVYLTSPQSLNFYANNIYDDNLLANVSLQLNTDGAGYVNYLTNTSGINNSNYAFEGVALTDGNYDYRIVARDNASQISTTNESSFIIDSLSPVVNIVSPADLFEVTTFNETLNLTYTIIERNPDTCYYNYNGTNVSASCDNSTYFFEYPTSNPDNITITVWAEDLYNRTVSESVTVVKNTVPPAIETVTLPDLATLGTQINSTWFINASDDNLDSCYYNTTDHGLTFVTCNQSITTTWTADGTKDITYCANDTLSNEQCYTDQIVVYIVEYEQTDIDPIAEGFTSTFTLQINATNIPDTNAYLVLDGTPYTYDRKFEYTDYDQYEVDVSIPDGLGNTTGVSQDWYWVYNFSDIFENVQTNTTDITIFALEIDDCSVYGDKILDLSLLDEELNEYVNGSGARIEIDVSIISSENPSFVEQFNLTWTDQNNASVCVPTGLLGTYEYIIEYIAGFQATDHVWEFHYLDNGTLDATKIFDDYTDSTISFMDLLTTDSTSFLFTYFDEDGLPVPESIVHVFRKYIGEGIFREVERSKADNNGETIVHLVEEDVIYYFLITLDGQEQFTSAQFNALCQTTPCEITLESTGATGNETTSVETFPNDWDLVEGGAYSITSNPSTRTVTLDYSNTEATSNVWNLTVFRYESDGTYTAVASDQESGVNGQIVVTVPQVAGNVSFFASVHRDSVFVTSKWVDFIQKVQDRMSVPMSIFLAVLIILTLGLIAVSEGAGTIAFVIFGLFLAGALGFLSTTLSTGLNIVIYLVVAGGILIGKLTVGRK